MTFHELDAIRQARDFLSTLRDDEKALVDDDLCVMVLRAQQAWPLLGERQQIILGLPCMSEGFGPELADLGLFEHNPSCSYRGRKHVNYEWIRTELGRVCWVLHYTLVSEAPNGIAIAAEDRERARAVDAQQASAQAVDELAAEAQKLKLGY